MNETRALAKFVAYARFSDLPDAVVQHTKNLLLDHFAVALYGSKTSWGQIAIKYAKQFSAIGDCTVYGEPWKTSAQHAALANGLCAHGYEMDDSYEGGFCHPGAPTIPAALAVAEKENASGKDLLVSIVMGYEVMGRISRALGRESNKQHHATGQVGAFGAASAAAKTMNLDEAAITNALGIAGCMASGVMEFADDPKGTMVKRLYGGWPSQSGVVAASFAREGFTGPATIVEGRFGFLRGISPKHDLSVITANLGSDYQILRTVFKPYASCRAFHPMIEAILELREKHGVAPDRFERVDVGVRESIMNQQIVYDPKSIMAAQYSMPFTAALAFHKDLTDPHFYNEAILSDPVVLSTMHKIHAHLDPDMNRFPRYSARVKVQCTDGRDVEVTAYDHKGTPEKPFTRDEMIARFHTLTSDIMSATAADLLIDAVSDLDKDERDGVQKLCACLRSS